MCEHAGSEQARYLPYLPFLTSIFLPHLEHLISDTTASVASPTGRVYLHDGKPLQARNFPNLPIFSISIFPHTGHFSEVSLTIDAFISGRRLMASSRDDARGV